jgi:hypothetical protein
VLVPSITGFEPQADPTTDRHPPRAILAQLEVAHWLPGAPMKRSIPRGANRTDPPPLKWSDLRYVFGIKEDCNGKEAIQA